jgi:hypothetical protein
MDHTDDDGCLKDTGTGRHWDPTVPGWTDVSSKVIADGHPLQVFTVRDICYTEDWVSTTDATLPEPRILTIVGWVFRSDDDCVHIAQLWDPTSECFGGGVVIPKTSIVNRKDLML